MKTWFYRILILPLYIYLISLVEPDNRGIFITGTLILIALIVAADVNSKK